MRLWWNIFFNFIKKDILLKSLIDDELLEKYNEIREEVKNSIKKEFDSEQWKISKN